MRSQGRAQSTASGSIKARVAGVCAIAALALTGCAQSKELETGWLPTERGTTSNTDRIIDLWVNSWIAALAVGLLTWGLIIWCIIAYRRRKGDTGYPKQLSYNLPLEVFYLTVPLLMVLVLFYFTDVDQRALDTNSENPERVVEVYGKQWAWDFNYKTEDRYDAGVQANLDGSPGAIERVPVLYLEKDKEVQFRLNSRDVIHSFWIPAFLQKKDMIPFKTNYITLTPQREGTFEGKCAELCGEYHSEMLFRVKVVDSAEFQERMAALPEGQLGDDYNRNPNAGLEDEAEK